MNDVLSLERTAVALEAYDWHFHNAHPSSNQEIQDYVTEQARLRTVLGLAFYQDTADRNSPDVANLIDPGFPVPPAHEETWLRKVVREWRESQS